jgi:hypothetical protein
MAKHFLVFNAPAKVDLFDVLQRNWVNLQRDIVSNNGLHDGINSVIERRGV